MGLIEAIADSCDSAVIFNLLLGLLPCLGVHDNQGRFTVDGQDGGAAGVLEMVHKTSRVALELSQGAYVLGDIHGVLIFFRIWENANIVPFVLSVELIQGTGGTLPGPLLRSASGLARFWGAVGFAAVACFFLFQILETQYEFWGHNT